MTATLEKKMTVEEYIQFETTSELRHEYIDGQLFEMPGEKLSNLKITAFLAAYLMYLLQEKGYIAYSHDAIVAIPNQDKYYCPDLVVTNEPDNIGNGYIIYEPVLIAEVISKTSRIRDTVDKYTDYTKINSLKYYLLIDPLKIYVTVYSRDANGQWEADAYNDIEEVIQLPLLSVDLPLKRFFS